MNIVLLQTQLPLQEVDLLLKEFPQYLFLTLNENNYKNLSPEHWKRIEIIFGNRLSEEELNMAQQLRWIHSPTPHMKRLCLHAIERQGNVLVTNSIDQNLPQVGEFVLACTLALAKNLFLWKEENTTPSGVWDSKLRDSMWTLKNRVFLQIGLNGSGTEIAKRMRESEMKVWGVGENKTFHPFCNRVLDIENYKASISEADVVCLCLSGTKAHENFFGNEELALMKDGAILISIGSYKVLDFKALVHIAKTKAFRGIVLDAGYQTVIPPGSDLWKIPGILITPEVSPRPKSSERLAFRTFLFNLRQYLYGNFRDMKNIVGHGMPAEFSE